MVKDSLGGYRLLPAAEADLEDIWQYSAKQWSAEQADRYTDELASTFDLLVSMPKIAPERHEFSPPVRIHAHSRHLIVYRIDDGHLAIVRVLGSRQNWRILLENQQEVRFADQPEGDTSS